MARKRAYNKTFSNLEFSNIAKTILEYDNPLKEVIGKLNEYLQVNHKGKSL